jgi:pSer/pThr/pTyr-binding forkhead associated (FHA) protein
MAILKVLREGREIQTLSLERGQEYIAGRADTCEIVLADPSMSRQHLKFYVDGLNWKVQVLSRFGHITHLGALHPTLELEDGIKFYSGEFEFRFEDVQEKSKQINIQHAVTVEKEGPLQLSVANEPTLEEKTTVGFVNTQPFVRVFNSKTQKTIDIRLTGQRWKAGRSPELQIVLDELSASRNHFEIRRAHDGFELIDLGSSNGTRLNGELLDENRPYPVVSGDILTIGATTIEFQVRDAQYTQRLQEAGLVPLPPPSYDMVPNGQKVRVIGGKKTFSPTPVHYGLMGILALILIMSLSGGDGGKKDLGSEPPVGDAPPEVAKKLTLQQQKYIEDTYNLADSLFKRGKYEIALIEIRKIHDIVPQYKRSKDLEAFCQQAIDISRERDEIERMQEKEVEIRSQVNQIIEDCRRRLQTVPSVSSVERCLAPATELDPENAQAKSLIEKVRREEEARDQKKAQNAAYNENVRRLTELYNKGVQEEKAGKLLDAVATYSKVIQSDLPDPKGLKGKAKTQMNAAKASIEKIISRSEDNATDLYSKEKFKEALDELQKALDLDPSNMKAKGLYDKIYNDLKKRLRAIYGDSVLEESLGNIEAAKQKWNSIIDMDLESGEYYQKAKRMLKKYGG